MNSSVLKTRKLILCALFVALICVGTFIRIPLPIVSFTLQLSFVLLAGILLGPRSGAICCVVYLAMGLIGLPVFTEGGGFGYVLKPGFGYILGFILGSFAAGKIARAVPKPSLKRLLAAHFVGMILIYLVGVVYMLLISDIYLGTGLGIRAVLLYGFALTAPADAALCVAGAFLARRLLPVLDRL